MKPTAIAAQASVGIVEDVVTERVHKAVLSATTRSAVVVVGGVVGEVGDKLTSSKCLLV